MEIIDIRTEDLLFEVQSICNERTECYLCPFFTYSVKSHCNECYFHHKMPWQWDREWIGVTIMEEIK